VAKWNVERTPPKRREQCAMLFARGAGAVVLAVVFRPRQHDAPAIMWLCGLQRDKKIPGGVRRAGCVVWFISRRSAGVSCRWI